jgi:hypothetical protein
VYGNTEVVPVYYCTFTLASIVGGAVVYNEFKCLTPFKGTLFISGTFCALFGVWLITSNREKSKEFQSISEAESKVTALEKQPTKSRLCFGLGCSITQAKTDYDCAADREAARRAMLAAHYPSSYRTAERTIALVASPPSSQKKPRAASAELSLNALHASLSSANSSSRSTPPSACAGPSFLQTPWGRPELRLVGPPACSREGSRGGSVAPSPGLPTAEGDAWPVPPPIRSSTSRDGRMSR